MRGNSMHVLVETDREYWRGVFELGGSTTMPLWTRDPIAGVAVYDSTIPEDLMATLRRLADQLEVSFSSVLLAAHARVLSALSGERHVVTGYIGETGRGPLPCRLTTEAKSWRELLFDTQRIEAQLLSHADFPLDEVRRELSVSGPAFETIFDLTGADEGLDEGIVLRLGIAQRGDELVQRLRYRTDVLDADCAARVAGYHLRALELIAADLDAEHGLQSLLSAEELAFQFAGLAGSRRELPDARVHELFEQRVRLHPDRVAAVCGGRSLTYGQLNARANRLARALLARGLGAEGVVAVVVERNLDWLAAVLAVLKAGGVYLPVEPHFPADRIAAILSRAECRLVLSEPGSTT